MPLRIKFSLFSCLLFQLSIQAQHSFSELENSVMDIVSNVELEIADVSELISEKENTLHARLALNQADYSQLNSLNILSQYQIQALLAHISVYGALVSPYELQTIEGFDLHSIRLLLPYIRIKISLKEELKLKPGASHQIRFGWAYRPEKSVGYRRHDSTRFQGSPFKQNLSYDFHAARVFSAGFHLEKDDGEPLSYLFSSAYVQIQLNRMCRKIILGDQQINLSQGLLIGSGLSLGKSALVMQILKNNDGAKPYKSYNETGFLRGISVQLKPSKQADLFLFAAHRNQDAALVVDSLSETVGSLNSSGNYRNAKEQSSKGNISARVSGLYLKSRFRSFSFGFGLLDVLKNRLPAVDDASVYKAFLIREAHSLKMGFDYRFSYKQCLFFGELAQSNFKGTAFLQGVLISAGKNSDISLLFRRYASHFDGQMSNAFAEYSGIQNESGFYCGFSNRLNRYWQMHVFIDLVQSALPRYRLNKPGFAHEQFIELVYKKKKDVQLQFRLRNQNKMYNSSESAHIKSIENHDKLSVRMQLEYEQDMYRLRCRVEQNIYTIGQMRPTQGFLFYQDLQIKVSHTFKVNFRASVFDAEDYNNRTFAFENNMPGSYAISSYYGKGFRYYALLQYHVNKDLQIWFRFARSRYEDRDELGSGLDLIQRPHSSDFNILLQWKIKNQYN